MADMIQSGITVMQSLVNNRKMKERAEQMLGSEKDANSFLASVINLYNDPVLSKCDANKVMVECLKAAALKLPVAKSLGFAYVVPYGNEPQFQLGYKGLIQLAQRSGQYKYLNAGCVYEGMQVKHDILSGMVEITGEAENDNIIGYFAFFELMNGYRKATFWTKAEVEAHAKKYSKAWKRSDSPWHTQFDAMAVKTVLKSILSKYGVISIEFADALDNDNRVEEQVNAEVAAKANVEEVVIPTDFKTEAPATQTAPQQIALEEECGF